MAAAMPRRLPTAMRRWPACRRSVAPRARPAAPAQDAPNAAPDDPGPNAPTPIRLLIFLHSFEPGGVESDALRLAAALRHTDIDTRIVMGRGTGPLRAAAPSLAFDVLQTGRLATARFETLWMILKLPAAIRRFRPDIILCAGNTYSVVAVAMKLLFGRNCPPIVLKVSNDLQRRDQPGIARALYHLWLRAQAGSFAAIVAMAAPARREIVETMRVADDRIVVINNASIGLADIDRIATARETASRQHDGRRFVAIGRLVPQKNFALLLRAFARIATPADRLVIAGDGPARAHLQALAEQLGIADRVSLPGHVHPVDQLLATADGFVLSSDYEGLGVVIVEALAAGIPIVATDCCVNMAMLLDGVGRRVPIRDVDALAAAMARMALDDVDVAAMRARARRFSVETGVVGWQALFTALMAEPHPVADRWPRLAAGA